MWYWFGTNKPGDSLKGIAKKQLKELLDTSDESKSARTELHRESRTWCRNNTVWAGCRWMQHGGGQSRVISD